MGSNGNAGSSVSLRERIAQFFDAFSIPGKLIGWIIRHLGFRALLLILAGACVTGGVVWLGFAPNFLVATYRTEAPKPKLGSKPKILDVAPLNPSPEWIRPYRFWLEDESSGLQKAGSIGAYEICALVSDMTKASIEPDLLIPNFSLELSTDRDCELNGFGFRETKDGLIEPLRVAKDKAKPASIFLSVTTALPGDKLLALVRVSCKQGSAPETCKDLFRSNVR